MLNRDVAAILLVLLICQLAGPAEASRDDIASTQRRHKEEAPFEGVGQNIQEKLSEAAQQLVQSSLAQADVTRKVASNIDQYHNHVKSIASTMGEVMQARRALTTAYDEDLKRGEESRVGALEVNLPEVLGEDTKWKEEDFHGVKDLSDVGGTSSRLPQTPSGEVAASAPLEVSTPEIPGTPVSLSQLDADKVAKSTKGLQEWDRCNRLWNNCPKDENGVKMECSKKCSIKAWTTYRTEEPCGGYGQKTYTVDIEKHYYDKKFACCHRKKKTKWACKRSPNECDSDYQHAVFGCR